MKACTGPCQQGRKECPTPWACEREEPYQEPKWYYLPEIIVGIAMAGVLLVSYWVAK